VLKVVDSEHSNPPGCDFCRIPPLLLKTAFSGSFSPIIMRQEGLSGAIKALQRFTTISNAEPGFGR
jgi:hypothetical protein